MVEVKPTANEQDRVCLAPHMGEEHIGFCSGEDERDSVSVIGKPVQPPACLSPVWGG